MELEPIEIYLIAVKVAGMGGSLVMFLRTHSEKTLRLFQYFGLSFALLFIFNWFDGAFHHDPSIMAADIVAICVLFQCWWSKR